MYQLSLDPVAEEQIKAVPQEALRPLAELFTLLETAPWSGEPFNPANRPPSRLRVLRVAAHADLRGGLPRFEWELRRGQADATGTVCKRLKEGS